LLRELALRRGAGAPPLISVVFNLEPVSRFPEIPGLTLEPAEPEVRFVAFDLSVNVTDAGSELYIDCDYSSDVLEPKTVRRFLGIYETLLRAAIADPDARISRMPLLSGPAMTALAAMWNGPVLPASSASALALFEEQAAHNPERTAVFDRQRRVSYGELDDRARRIAGELAKLGVRRETRVGVCAGRTADLIAGLLAVWKAGGAYVPLDPQYPTSRLEFMLDDAGIDVLLTDRACAPVFAKHAARLVFVDGDYAPMEASPDTVQPRDLAYVIYTSGSTGKPKGVAITQANLSGLVDWARSFYAPDQLRGVLFSTSVCFDISVFEIFVPLACGAALVIAENALDLPRLPSASEVTLINTVPSVVPELLRSGPLPASVDTFQLAGERLLRSVVQRIYRQTAVRQVLNLYGPTEDTVYSTGAIVERDDELAPSIGRPLLNKRALILDRHLQPVPPGIAGEPRVDRRALCRQSISGRRTPVQNRRSRPLPRRRQHRIPRPR
jgi:amino acid adenylation domain-containing protein